MKAWAVAIRDESPRKDFRLLAAYFFFSERM